MFFKKKKTTFSSYIIALDIYYYKAWLLFIRAKNAQLFLHLRKDC